MSNQRNTRRRRPGRSNNSSMGNIRSLQANYIVRLAQPIALTTNGSGIVNQAIVCDPSSTGQNFPEYKSISGLYSTVRILGFRVQFCVQNVQTTGFTGAPMVVGGALSTLGSPGSYDAVCQNADSKFWALGSDHSRFGYTHTLRLRRNLAFANVGSPDPGDFAGCPGCIQVYASTWPNGTTIASCLVEGIYEFKSRT